MNKGFLSKYFNEQTKGPAAWTIGLGALTAINLFSGGTLGLIFAAVTGYGAFQKGREWKHIVDNDRGWRP